MSYREADREGQGEGGAGAPCGGRGGHRDCPACGVFGRASVHRILEKVWRWIRVDDLFSDACLCCPVSFFFGCPFSGYKWGSETLRTK